MNDLVLNTPGNKKIKLTGLSAFQEIRLSTGKHTVSTFTLKTHLVKWGLALGIGILALAIYEGILFALHIPKAWFYFGFDYLAIFAILTALVISKTSLRGIHGAEHMTIRALESRQPLTKDLIMQQSPISDHCGTMLTTLILVLGILWLICALNQIFAPSMPMYVKLGFNISVLTGFALLSFNFFRLSNWIQKTFFISLPNESQLNLAYEQGLALIHKYNADPH
jgi:hypothetical protein